MRIVTASAVAACSLLLLAPGGALAAGHRARLHSLGPPPDPCLPLGASMSKCGFNTAAGIPPNLMPSTFYGQLEMSPHIVRLGQTATEIIVPNAAAATPQFPIHTRWYPPGTPRPGTCLDDPATGYSTTYSCAFTVTVNGDYPATSGPWRGGWNVVQLGICGFLGCSPSATYWYVLAKGRAVSGTVLDASGRPVAGASVDVSGPTSGTVRTDKHGFYNAIGLIPGRYSVSVPGHNGQPTRCTPGSAHRKTCALNLARADGAADFAVCPAKAKTAARSLFGGPDCPLLVKVTLLERSVKAGLHFANHVPAFFGPTGQTDPSPDSADPFEQTCVTGCSNVLVTVKDPNNHDPHGNNLGVAGATVKLIAAAVLPRESTYPYPLFSGFKGEVCVVTGAAETGCGATASTTTDQHGHAYFRYWSPGVVANAGALLTANAHDTSSACACGSRSGKDQATLELLPNLAFKAPGTLTEAARKHLIEWREGKRISDDIAPFATAFGKIFPELNALGNIRDKQDLEVVAWFFTTFKLQPEGLLVTDPRDYITLGLAGKGFEARFVDTLKDYADYLRITPDLHGRGIAQYMRLILSEQSYCAIHVTPFGAPTLCTNPDQANFILFSLEGAKDRSDLTSLHSNFDQSPPTSTSYHARDWMRAQY